MIIENIAASFPSRKVSNEEVIDLIRFHSTAFEGDLEKTLRIVKTLLNRSGLVNRNWCAAHERPIDHLTLAVRQALEPSSIQPAHIDLLVYVGIGGGFREPGNSYMVAKALGCRNAECFDIIDACMSWTRGMSLVDSLFKTGHYRNALIVNAEFNMAGSGPLFLPHFELQHIEQLEYTLPTFTIGEAATATLLLPRNLDNFSITFHSKPDFADLCMIPVAGYQGFSYAVTKLGEGRFTARGAELHDRLTEQLPILIAKSEIDPTNADIVFTHSSSTPAWDKAGAQYGFAEKIFHIYPETGNIVSASVPAAVARAKEAGKLAKGNQVVSFMGSAGMSFAVSRFIY